MDSPRWSPAPRAASERRAPASSPAAVRRSRSSTSTRPAPGRWPTTSAEKPGRWTFSMSNRWRTCTWRPTSWSTTPACRASPRSRTSRPSACGPVLAVVAGPLFWLTRAALPRMYRKGYGRIINISSVHGIRASEYKVAYVTAKHALEGLSKVTALEGGPHGVTSNCVNPGYVRTPLVTKQIADQARTHGIDEQEVIEQILLKESAIKRLVEPAEVADLVGWLASPNAGMVT